MRPWNGRAIETRNLFNPAFCGVILLRALKAFEGEDEEGMPFSLALLVTPLCLHSTTRQTLLSGSRSYLIKVVEENPEILIGFAERARNLLPYTLEAMGFIMQLGCFEVSERGHLKIRPRAIQSAVRGSNESIECQKAAQIVGRQFGRIADRVTIYTLFGVRP
jgi:hypothetical protein